MLSLFTDKIYRENATGMLNTKCNRDSDKARSNETEDPVLSMLGVGSYLWESESGEKFVERLRSEDPTATPPRADPDEDLPDAVWGRISQFQGEQFHTARRLPFTFEVEGNGIWFFREGKRINRKLTRAQVDLAISRCPLNSTTEIKDLMDYAYLYALLVDRRIRGDAW
jgi:hypothetical protein